MESLKNPLKPKLLYPSIVITLCALFLIYKYILQVYPSIMTNSLMRVFHVSGAGLGNLAATFFYTYLITQLFVGILIDKFGTRILASTAIFISALGAYFFSHANTLLAAELSRALIGVGVAFATVTYLKMAAVWFPARYFAFVGGLLATAAMLGAVFGEAPLAMVTDHLGWRDSLTLCAIIGFVLAILFFAIVRNEPKTLTVLQQSAHKEKISWHDVKTIFTKKENWMLTFYSGLAFSPLAVFAGLWGNPFLQEAYQITNTEAALFVSISFIGLALGGPTLGALAEYIKNKKRVMSISALVSLISISLVIYLPQPVWLLSICLFIFGFTSGAFMLGFVIGKEINKPFMAATVIAMINTGDAIFGAGTEPLVGKFLDLGWSGKLANSVPYFTVYNYHMAFLTLPVYLLIAWLLSICITSTKHPSC